MLKHLRQRLVVQLGVAIALISLACVTLMGVVSYSTSRIALKEAYFTQISGVANGLELALGQWLQEQLQDLHVLVRDPDFARHAVRLLEGRRNTPETLAAYRHLHEHLSAQVEENPDFREVLLLSARGGEVRVASNPAHEGSYQHDSAFYQEGLLGETVQQVYAWPQTLEPTMTLSLPVASGGVVLGVLAVHLHLRHVLAALHAHPSIGSSGTAYVIDRFHAPVGAFDSWQQTFPRGFHSAGIDAALTGESGEAIYRDFLGQEVVGAYRWLDRFGLALLIETPVQEAFASARDLGLAIFAIGVVGTLLLSAGITLLARRTIRPMLEVARAAQTVAAGDLRVPPVAPGKAEIGVLVESFNHMVRQIQELVDEVRDREQRYSTVFNATDEAIFVHSPGSRGVRDCNQAALRIFGLTPGEAIPDVVELSAGYPPYDAEGIDEKLQATLAEGSQQFEWRSRRKSGELFWSEVALTRMEVGGEDSILAVVRDIDQRKRTEAELDEYRRNLEWTIEDRTRQLEETQKALVTQERLAVLGQLTATVSHELRNPLGTMSNALYTLDLALESGATEAARKALEMIERNVRRCDKIIGELLDFTRSHEIERQATLLDDWLAEALDEYLLPEGILLERSLASGVTVSIDRESMRRAMVNLLDNAVQAVQDARSHGKLIEVCAFVKDRQAVIEVRDQGPGIPEKDRAKIFEPLYSTKEFGVGLGVPIVHNVMQKQGGRLDYFCHPGGGTVAVLTLPIDAAGESHGE